MRTSETAYRHVSGWLPGTVLALALLLSGCGEPADPLAGGDPGTAGPGSSRDGSGPDDPAGTDGAGRPENPGHPSISEDTESAGGAGSPDDTRGDEPEPVRYEWGLPPSDTSVGQTHQGVEGSAYLALQRDCAAGAEFLARDLAPTYGFESPRNVLLFAAGVRLCEGDRASASNLFKRAEVYGTAGLAPENWAFCVLYRVVGSVLEQRPHGDFSCADGASPPFVSRTSDTGEPRTDDPLTLDVDESTPEPEDGPGGATGGGQGTGQSDDGAGPGTEGQDGTGGEGADAGDSGDGELDSGSGGEAGGGGDAGTAPEEDGTSTGTGEPVP